MAVSIIRGGYETASLSFGTGDNLGTVLRKKDGVVSLSLAWTGTLNAGSFTSLCNIPSEYRPKETAFGATAGRLTNNAVSVYVQPSGEVQLYNNGASYADFFFGNCTWII